MDSESPEIDFLSLEDELYDHEITQILSQPSAAEKSTLNTPELPPDVDSLVDHLSVELKHAEEKLFQVDPPGTPERDASKDEDRSSQKQISGEKQCKVQDVENQNDESSNLLDEISNEIEKENTKRMGQLSVELKEAAEKLFAVDPLGSSEREFSSSDQSSSCSDSSSEADDQSRISENAEEQSDSGSVHSLSRQTPVESDSVDSEDQSEKSTENSNKSQWNETNNCNLKNDKENNCERKQDSNHEGNVELGHDVGISDDESSDKLCTLENDNFCVNNGDECTLLITDVRSENVEFHQNEHVSVTKPSDHEDGLETEALPSDEQSHNFIDTAQSFSNSLINLEENETGLIVENVFSLSEERKEDCGQSSVKDEGEDDTCETLITSRSLRDRKAMSKSNTTETNQPQEPKKKRRMKRSLKTNTRQIVRKTQIKSNTIEGLNSSNIDDRDTESLQNRQECFSKDEIAKEKLEKEKLSAFTIQKDGQYKCHYCSCILSTKGRFQLHILRLHNKKYTCRHCGKMFLKCQDLAIHVKTRHSDELKYKVCKTGEVISFKKEQQKSKRLDKKCTFIVTKDNGKLSYACGYCDKVFDIQQSLACHIRNKHILPNNSGKLVYQKSGKFKRKKAHNLAPMTADATESTMISDVPKKKVRRSTIDQLEYDDAQDDPIEPLEKRPRRDTKASRAAERGLEKIAKLQEDFNIHISHQTFRCCYCPKWFFKKADLSNHMQKHVPNPMNTKEGPEKETKIENIAEDVIGRDGRKKRSENKEFFCKYCTSKYKSLDTLKIHIVRHLGELYKDDMIDNKLECAFCGQYFYNVNCANIGQLMNHLFHHYAPDTKDIDVYNLLECRYCGVPFLSIEKLRPHEHEHEKFLQAKRRKTETMDQMKKEECVYKKRENISPKSTQTAEADSAIAKVDDPVPFTCGMCSSRFPTSQYLLHHMTLHMKGKYVFRVEVDKSKPIQESKPSEECKPPEDSPVEPVPPDRQSVGHLVPKNKTTKQGINSLSENKAQHISPLVQDRIMSMLRMGIPVNDDANQESPKCTSRKDNTKPRDKTVAGSSSPPSKKNDNKNNIRNTLADVPNMHNYARAPQRNIVSRNYVSIITKQPIRTLSIESQGSSTESLPAKTQNLEMNRNKRKQTFHASEIKSDFQSRPLISYKEVVNNSRNKPRLVSETEDEESRGAFDQSVKDLRYRSSTETGEDDFSDDTNNDTDSVKIQPSRLGSKYTEVKYSSESSSSSDSASDFERDWKSRYNKKKKKIGRKRKKRFRKSSAAKKLSNTENGWKKKNNFAESKLFECSFCSYKCSLEEKFLLHMRTHSPLEEKVQCNIGHEEFSSEQHLLKHKNQHRSNEYQCSQCGLDFATSGAIMSHIEEVHKST